MKYSFFKMLYIYLLLIYGFCVLCLSSKHYNYETINIVLFYSFPILYTIYYWGKSTFTMTLKKINKFNETEELEFDVIYDYNHRMQKMFVRTKKLTAFKWYELDYELTIPQKCSCEKVKMFMNDVINIKKLKTYMEKNVADSTIQANILYNKGEKQNTYWCVLILLLILYFFVFAFKLTNVSYYYY